MCIGSEPEVDVHIKMRDHVSVTRSAIISKIVAQIYFFMNLTHEFSLPSSLRHWSIMSAASKATLATTLLGTIGIVAFVHWGQKVEKAAMHAGVIRDEENQRRKREVQEERRLDFELQRQLEEEFKKTQTVHDSTTGA